MYKFDEYYEARNIVTKIIKQDLLGPVKEDEIIEDPARYYIAGKLYPIKTDIKDFSETFGIEQSASEFKESESVRDDKSKTTNLSSYVFENSDEISLCNTPNPSAMGLSFTINTGVTNFKISVNYATYKEFSEVESENNKAESTDDKKKKKKTLWKRYPHEYTLDYNVSLTKKYETFISENLKLTVLQHKTYSDGTKTMTVSISNTKTECDRKEFSKYTLFQPKIKIYANNEKTFVEAKKNVYLAESEESKQYDLLYSKTKCYAQGHGCAASWDIDPKTNSVNYIQTEFLPEYELFQMKPSDKFKGNILSAEYISKASKEDIIKGINDLCNSYNTWINETEQKISSIEERLKYSAEKNIKKCRESCERIRLAADIINKDKNVEMAFRLANKAMYMQDMHKKWIKEKDKLAKNNKPAPKLDDLRIDFNWYPFQLAFMLQELESIANKNSKDRNLTDLLWFPTGGGKTEAYLGIAAFTIFLRRLKQGIKGSGVAVFTRYTLRLLSFQQFERAAALICACDLIRQEENIPGEPITIGLWAGTALTPNKIEDAEVKLGFKPPKGDKEDSYYESIGDPKQIKRCPWCGREITQENYCISGNRMIIHCPDKNCEFSSEEGLPIMLIDEEIYQNPPTFIVSTVDKFAQVALNDGAGAIFGIAKSGNEYLPPDLIIQDELHLISGPLGTITGLYESAIIGIITRDDRPKPKIIASTATIKNADEQIKALYASDYSQFPAQGIDIEDSFFAIISKPEDKPSRKYLGCMGIGTSPTMMMIRVMSSLLFATRYLASLNKYSNDIIDSFWTLTIYFNSLRELGGAIIRVIDDIQAMYEFLKETKFHDIYNINESVNVFYDEYQELTSRIPSEAIGKVLLELENKYPKDKTKRVYDFLLASNMISVGVDVSRLGTMVVVGQPKLTAEYIQATSRVGRSTPGLVIATYNQAKSRDRSHFEQFTQYHQTFYKYVEATSLTPFADRARDRALQTVYVMLCRYWIDDLRDNVSAGNYNKNDPRLGKIRKYILDYVEKIDKQEYQNVEKELEDIEEEWQSRVHPDLIYKKTSKFDKRVQLFDRESDEIGRFRVLNSMRSVETTVPVTIEE